MAIISEYTSYDATGLADLIQRKEIHTQDVIESAIKFVSQNEKMQPKKPIINLENKGFFEKLFEYFTGK